MELNPLDLVIHIVNIVVLFFLLRLILYKPVARFLSERSERINKQLSDAENKLKEAEEMKLEYQRQLDRAEAQEHDIVRGAEAKAAQEASAIIADANSRAEKIIAEAQDRIEKEKKRAVEQMQVEIAQLAIDIAARILKREVNAADSILIAEQFFSEMRTK
jgi:F-type H+-transporting ATPase subunit b